MDEKLYRKLIARIPLFKPLAPAELSEIIRISKLVKVRNKAMVIKEGHAGNAMFMLVEGTCRVDKRIPGSDRTHKLAEIVAPSVFGEIALIDGSPRTASVSTVTECVLLRVDQTQFNRLRKAYHPAAFKIIRQLAYTLCSRLGEKTDRLFEFYKNPEKNLGRIEELFLNKGLQQ